jgi:hypothetical protein
MMDVDVERTVEQLYRGICAVENPTNDPAEAVATLKRLIAVGERELGPVTDWNRVPALQV